jgi:hypothetical protein
MSSHLPAAISIERAERYSRLGDALRLNPDLRFPNLDKVLPLPLADLPMWDGQFDTLVNAAKSLMVSVTLSDLRPHQG